MQNILHLALAKISARTYCEGRKRNRETKDTESCNRDFIFSRSFASSRCATARKFPHAFIESFETDFDGAEERILTEPKIGSDKKLGRFHTR